MKQRLVIFTGKGGVGKTTLAMAYAKYLHTKNIKVKYNSFYQEPDYSLLSSLNIPIFDVTPDESAEVYIANKLNSKTIASWIMHTHFFKSLFQMLPGLSHMILLGHILKELENDPELVIILDSPASGHALTMFEASDNFKKIFKAGLIVDDIEKMKSKLEDPLFLKTFIVALPNELAVQEASELKIELSKLYQNFEIIINNSLKEFCSNKNILENDLPDFLKLKIESESKVINDISKNEKDSEHPTFQVLPHIPEDDFKKIVSELQNLMRCLE